MSQQMPPFQPGSATSEAAAVAAMESAPTRREEVYEFLKSRGEHGATDDEIQQALGYPRSSVGARRNELMNEGLIIDSGDTRATRYGRQATIWLAKGST